MTDTRTAVGFYSLRARADLTVEWMSEDMLAIYGDAYLGRRIGTDPAVRDEVNDGVTVACLEAMRDGTARRVEWDRVTQLILPRPGGGVTIYLSFEDDEDFASLMA